jgi:putative glycosyltransferase (TIGR04348 family)
MRGPSVVIVSPALAAANNGNWQTARRWQLLLGPHWRGRVRLTQRWPDAQAADDGMMLALHARRSAEAIQAWSERKKTHGLAVVLTGTDLYQDIATDTQAQRSLQLARRLVVLQELGVAALPAAVRDKARVIYQSTPARAPLAKTSRELRAVMVGHLREVKSPTTLFDAARRLAGRPDIRIRHIGAAGEPMWADLAHATERDCPNYRWTGELPHAQARQAIQRAHVLVHTSAMEGGAHVIMEAVRSGTPVLASRVPGNVGMLGAGYEGYFEHGDAPQLAALLERCRSGQAPAADDPEPPLLERLRAQCALRAPLFAPEAEQAALLELLKELQDPS